MAAAEKRYSISELAKLCALDRATVAKRLDQVAHSAGPKGAKAYELKHALPVLIAGESSEMDEAKLRKVQAEAELKEHELAVERGDYVRIKDVETQRVKEVQWLYNRLLAQLPREASPQLYKSESAPHLEETLKHEIGRVLNEWREF